MKSIITSSEKFFGSNQRILLKCEGNQCIGFIKVGNKNLFIYNQNGEIKEINPLCVLDFYVHESCQRSGYGKELFTFMLQSENIEAKDLGFDRPSEKFISFLKKHFNLTDYVPQNNNFVVFNDYFYHKKLLNNQHNQLFMSRASNGKCLLKENTKENNLNPFNSPHTNVYKHKSFASLKKSSKSKKYFDANDSSIFKTQLKDSFKENKLIINSIIINTTNSK